MNASIEYARLEEAIKQQSKGVLEITFHVRHEEYTDYDSKLKLKVSKVEDRPEKTKGTEYLLLVLAWTWFLLCVTLCLTTVPIAYQQQISIVDAAQGLYCSSYKVCF